MLMYSLPQGLPSTFSPVEVPARGSPILMHLQHAVPCSCKTGAFCSLCAFPSHSHCASGRSPLPPAWAPHLWPG